MLKYTIQRILSLIPVLFIVTVLVFSIIHLTPGDPAAAMLGLDATKKDIAALHERLGLDKPLLQQYLDWMAGVFHGDLGDSIFLGVPVTEALAEHFGPTLVIALLAQLLAILIALPLGTLAAVKRGGKLDLFARAWSLLGTAVPSFLLALLLMMLFAVRLRMLPVAGWEDADAPLVKQVRYMVLPVLSLGIVQSASILRITRSSVIEALEMDSVRTERSLGIPERTILFKHVLRNAGLPILTAIGTSFGFLITGTVIIETIFGIPGVGQLVINSVTRRDYEVIQGSLLVIAVVLSLINLAVDLLYGLIDHRARLWKE